MPEPTTSQRFIRLTPEEFAALRALIGGGGGTPSALHNNLGGLQGGTTGQYYHLTSAQITALHAAVTVTAAPLTISGQALTFNYDTNDFQLSGNNLQVKDGGIDHNSLANLATGDPHTLYALLAGRAGGQTIIGGTGAGDDLTVIGGTSTTSALYLQSNNTGTKTNIYLGAAATSFFDEVNERFSIGFGAAPGARIETHDQSGGVNPAHYYYHDTTVGNYQMLYFFRSGGTFASPSKTTGLTDIGAISGAILNGAGTYTLTSMIRFRGTAGATAALTAGALYFYTCAASGSPSDRFSLQADGYIYCWGPAVNRNLWFLMNGQAARSLGMDRHSTAATAGNNLTILAGGCKISGSNLNGGDLLLSGGESTGSGTSSVKIYTYPGTAAATTDNAAYLTAAWAAAGSTLYASLAAATGNQIGFTFDYTVNKATSGNDTGVLIKQTDTSSPGTSLMLDLQVGTTSKFNIDNAGLVSSASYHRALTSIYRRYYHLPMASANPGASGATWINPDANTVGGWNVTNAAHVLSFNADVHSDWDGATDLTVEIRWCTNWDNSGGADTDTVDLRLQVFYKGVSDTATKSQTVEVATTIGKAARYKQFKTTFTVDWDYASNVVEVGDVIRFLLNLETDTSEGSDNVIISDGSISYQTTHVGIESGDT